VESNVESVSDDGSTLVTNNDILYWFTTSQGQSYLEKSITQDGQGRTYLLDYTGSLYCYTPAQGLTWVGNNIDSVTQGAPGHTLVLAGGTLYWYNTMQGLCWAASHIGSVVDTGPTVVTDQGTYTWFDSPGGCTQLAQAVLNDGQGTYYVLGGDEGGGWARLDTYAADHTFICQILYAVRSISTDGAGHVFALMTDGSIDLCASGQATRGSIASDESVYFLQASGELDRWGGGQNFSIVDTGVQSYQVGTDGGSNARSGVYYANAQGLNWWDASTGSIYLGTVSIYRAAPEGGVYWLDASGWLNGWDAQHGTECIRPATSFQIGTTGGSNAVSAVYFDNHGLNEFDKNEAGPIYLGTVSSYQVDPVGGVYRLDPGGSLNHWDAQNSTVLNIAQNVSAFQVTPDGGVCTLTADGELDRYAVGQPLQALAANVSRLWIDASGQVEYTSRASLSADGTLSVIGDDRGDRLVVDVTYDGVSVEGSGITVNGTVVGSVDRQAVQRILIIGGAGNDTLGVEAWLPSWVYYCPLWQFASLYSKAVSAMAIPAVLVGGAGSNVLYNHGFGTAAFVQPGAIQAFSDSDETAMISTPLGQTTISGNRYDSLVSGPGESRQFQGSFWDKVMDYVPGVVATIVTTIITDGIADEVVGPTLFGSTTLAEAASAALSSAASQGIIDLGTGSGFSLTSMGLSIVLGGVGGYLQPTDTFPYNDFSLSGTYVGADPWDEGLLALRHVSPLA
jgi:hypothetical protein